MKKTISLLLGITGLLAGSAFTFLARNWNIDPGYAIKFSGRRAEGTFSGLSGRIAYDPDDLEHALIDVTVDARTIQTGNSTKDGHARGSSWLDTEKYSVIRFTSTSFERSGDQNVVAGRLELHGVSKPVQIPFRFSPAANGGTFTGTFTINRKDYGIEGNFFGFAVGDAFEVTLRVPVTGP